MADNYEAVIEPVRSKRTFEEVSDRLKELIFNGTLKVGQRLPPENELARLFQVGRQSVREALRVLELSGFISVRAGVKGGAVIEGTMLSKMTELFLDTFKRHKISLKDCVSARMLIEVSMLDLVVQYADSSDIDDLRKNVAGARAKFEAGQSTYEENIQFHRILAQASKNNTLSIVMESILAIFSDFKSRSGFFVDPKQSKGVIDAHEALTDAIAARNIKEAVAMLKRDLENGAEILISTITE